MLVCSVLLWHLLNILTYCLARQTFGLQCVIVAFVDHTYLLFG